MNNEIAEIKMINRSEILSVDINTRSRKGVGIICGDIEVADFPILLIVQMQGLLGGLAACKSRLAACSVHINFDRITDSSDPFGHSSPLQIPPALNKIESPGLMLYC